MSLEDLKAWFKTAPKRNAMIVLIVILLVVGLVQEARAEIKIVQKGDWSVSVLTGEHYECKHFSFFGERISDAAEYFGLPFIIGSGQAQNHRGQAVVWTFLADNENLERATRGVILEFVLATGELCVHSTGVRGQGA